MSIAVSRHEFAIKLIDIVERNTMLYDPRHPDFQNPNEKADRWLCIATELDTSGKLVLSILLYKHTILLYLH